MKETLIFMKSAVVKPMQVAYLLPSSPWLVKRIAKEARLTGAKRIVELGPGIGVTTRAILGAMDSDAELLALEVNPKFVQHINKTISDPRLTTKNQGAENLLQIMDKQGWKSVDVVIAGMPFSTLPKGLDRKIVTTIHQSLKPGGLFLASQMRDHVNKLATPLFGGLIEKKTEYKNLPPMKVFVWKKP